MSVRWEMWPERRTEIEALAGTPDADGDLWQQACERAFAIRDLLAEGHRRVSELLGANNAEVERRRAAEQLLREVLSNREELIPTDDGDDLLDRIRAALRINE